MSHPLPDWIEPMAATLTKERFSSPEWSFERKLDGIRLLAYKDGRHVQLFSRNRLLQNDAYPGVVEALVKLPIRNAILDGEATGVWGTPGRVTYHVFDILWLDGEDVRSRALDERRRLLDTLTLRAPLERVAELRGKAPWEVACRNKWEGVVAKRRSAPYEGRRSPHWLKMKCEASQELVVGGFTDPLGTRVGLGALLVGYYDAGDLVFAGKVGTGFDTRLLLDLRARLQLLQIARSPFTRATGLPRLHVHWVRPDIVVQVAFVEWTVHGKLRHSRLLGVRTDKAPRDVVREER